MVVVIVAVTIRCRKRGKAGISVAIQLLNDIGKRLFILGTGNDVIAVGIEHPEGAHDHRLHGFAPRMCELVEAEIAVTIGVAGRKDTDRIVGLEVGADDYVTKPFGPRELLARTESVIRRAHGLSPDCEPPATGTFKYDRRSLDTGKPCAGG